MPLPLKELGVLLGGGLGSVVPGLGTGIGMGLGGALGAVGDWYFQEPDPMAQQNADLAQQQFQASQQLLQQMQQPNYDQQENEERLAFERDILPRIAQQFGSQGALGSSAFENALVRGREDLGVRLAALRQRGELARQGLLGNYLTGQQNLGMNLLQLGQGQQNQGLQGLSNFGNYASNMGNLDLNRRNAPVNAGFQAANIGRGMQGQAMYHPAGGGILPGIVQGVATGMKAAGY